MCASQRGSGACGIAATLNPRRYSSGHAARTGWTLPHGGQKLTLEDLVTIVGAPLEPILAALYRLARADPFTIFTPGCDTTELDAAERRIGRPLPALHRFLMTLTNGGTLPWVNSLDRLAAAVPREREWRWTGPLPPQSESSTFDAGTADGPFTPLILGDSIADCYDPAFTRRLDLESFIVIASGFDGEFFGYVREEPARVDFVSQDSGRGTAAPTFDQFISRQSMSLLCRTPEFIDRVRISVRGE